MLKAVEILDLTCMLPEHSNLCFSNEPVAHKVFLEWPSCTGN